MSEKEIDTTPLGEPVSSRLHKDSDTHQKLAGRMLYPALADGFSETPELPFQPGSDPDLEIEDQRAAFLSQIDGPLGRYKTKVECLTVGEAEALIYATRSLARDRGRTWWTESHRRALTRVANEIESQLEENGYVVEVEASGSLVLDVSVSETGVETKVM